MTDERTTTMLDLHVQGAPGAPPPAHIGPQNGDPMLFLGIVAGWAALILLGTWTWQRCRR